MKKLESQCPPEFFLMRELSALRKSHSLQDPSMSPSWKSINVGSLLNKLEKQIGNDDEIAHQVLPQANGTLQRFVSMVADGSRALERFVSVADNLAGNTAREDSSHATLKGGKLCQSESWADTSHGDGEQLGSIHTPYDHGKQGKISNLDIASEDTGDGGNMDTMRGPLNALCMLKVIGKQEGYNSLPLLTATATQVLGGSCQGRPEKDTTTPSKVEQGEGSFVYGKGRSPFGFELRAKSKPRNRSFRKGKSQRIRRAYLQSPSFQTRKGREMLYTGLITPSRSRRNWRMSPLMDQLTANTYGGTDELEISELPRSGCGTPWSWSRIHSRRRQSILKMAAMSIPCGSSDSITKKAGKALSHQSSSGESILGTMSEFSDTTFNTDSESLPLLEHSPLLNCGNHIEHGFSEQTGKGQINFFDISPSTRGQQLLGGGGGMSSSSESNHHSLNQKYMPKSFREIVGQNLITQALCNALSRGKIAPMYIFYGPRGTGKTSCAKIFAAALNCLSSEGQRPCGSCTECSGGNTSMIKEFNVGGTHGIRGIKTLMHDVIWSSSSHYNVFVVNECHTLSSQSWNAFLKVVEEAPRNIVFILSTSSLEHLPHAVISRCQKFLFSKIKESEIMNRLQLIALQEGMEADAEAFKLIASTCDGSLRDAEMMLDQLSLLGQKISLAIVQELMGLIPDDKLVQLLDAALSADTVNTVRNLRELLESGAEPLNVMSQLGCLITSILAGGYQISSEKQKRKFFRHELTKEDMERLRQALKTLSEAEKQLRDSSDRMTWLTAALLQFAPDQSYLLSSTNTSVTQSPEGPDNANMTPELKSLPQRKSETQYQHTPTYIEPAPGTATECASNGMSDSSRVSVTALSQSSFAYSQAPKARSRKSSRLHLASGTGHLRTMSSTTWSSDSGEARAYETILTNQSELEEVWQRFLDAVHSNSLRKFLMTQGKLLSLSLSKGFAVALLEFSQLEHTSRAKRSRTSIAHAFQCTLGYPVDIKVCLVSATEEQLKRQTISGDQLSSCNSLRHSPWSQKANSDHVVAEEHGQKLSAMGRHQIQSLGVSSTHPLKSHQKRNHRSNQSFEMIELETGKTTAMKKLSLADKHEADFMESSSKVGKHHEVAGFRLNGIEKNGASLGFVMQHTEGSSIKQFSQDLHNKHMNEGSLNLNFFRHGGSEFEYTTTTVREGHSAMVAAKLEEENMRLESKTGVLPCWSATERGHAKVRQLHRSPQRPGFLLGLCPCAKSNHQ